MEPVGKIFQLKIPPSDLRSQLVPSFATVLDDWVKAIARTPFSDPKFVLDVTYITEPLRIFLRNVVDGLDSYVVVGGPIERGFGFGKTHSLILLWHMFTSDIYKHVNIDRNIEDLVRDVLVLGIDFNTDMPLLKIIDELRAYTNPRHPVQQIKNGQLIRAISEVIRDHRLSSLHSSDLAILIGKILRRYQELGGTPRILLLIDELGWGLVQRLRKYAEKTRSGEKADDIYVEADSILSFLSFLYAELEKIKPLSGVVIWVIAEQDRRELDTLVMKYQDHVIIHDKIKSLLRDLDTISERYSRGLAGRSLCEIHYSYEHAIEIARHRLLKVVENADDVGARERFIEWLKKMSKQLNLGDVFRTYESEIRKYHPFSIGLLNLLKKLMNPLDTPGTEFVRTVISVVAEASQNALMYDPEGSYTIGIKHLRIEDIVQSKLMREVGNDWAEIAGDIELALDRIDSDKRTPAELAAKYLLAKGITANLSLILEPRDKRDLRKYGTTIHEIQLEVLESFVGTKAQDILEKLGDAIDTLITESARVDVIDHGEERYYLPSMLKTVYNKLISYVTEEKKKIENEQLIPAYLRETGTIESLFGDINVVIDGRRGDTIIKFVSYEEVKNPDMMFSNDAIVQKAQLSGKLLILLVSPWDVSLFNEVYIRGRSYNDVVEDVARLLQNAVMRGKIKRPLHVVLLLPDLSRVKLRRVLDKLTTYVGTKEFLNYLTKKESIIREKLQELEKRESILIKRDLISIINEEMRRKHMQLIENRAEREIAEARSLARKQLVRLARDLVSDVLELYHSAIYYSLDENRFTQKEIILTDVVKTPGGREEGTTGYDLSNYASMVNAFFNFVIKELAYEYEIIRIQRALMQAYRTEFERSTPRSHDKIGDVLENLMQGAYGVKPLSLDIAREAVKYLNNQMIELDKFLVTVSVDEGAGLLRFNITPKSELETDKEETVVRAKELTQATPPLASPGIVEHSLQRIVLELPGGFSVDDILQRLLAFMNMLKELNVRVFTIKFELDTAKFSLSSTLKNIDARMLSESKIKTLINFISRISKDESIRILAEINVSQPIAEDNVKKVFSDYYKHKPVKL